MYEHSGATQNPALMQQELSNRRRAIWLSLVFWLAWGGLIGARALVAKSQAAVDPSQPGPCSVITQTVTISTTIQTNIYYPNASQCGPGLNAPYPAIAFSHGFSMFGFSNGAAENAGNGRHLASWGYVVAVPRLQDDAETRIAETVAVLNYIETAASTQGSFLYGKVDTARLATAGHSLGGSTALAIAARDTRIKAVVGLDPVYHSSDFSGQEGPPIWNPQAEAPNITVPTGILGSPPSTCNAQADYTDIYPLVGATHKASFLVVGASHCVFADPGNSFCSFTCSGTINTTLTRLTQKYMTAWFNYYLWHNTDYYTYLYGVQADADISNGSIVRQVSTAPRRLTAISSGGVVTLTWQLYNHPVVAGYNVYRRLPGQSYPETPYAHLGPVSLYCDAAVAAGQVYSYTVRSYDSAGNLHQVAQEVSVVAQGGGIATSTPTCTPQPVFSHWVYLPVVFRP